VYWPKVLCIKKLYLVAEQFVHLNLFKLDHRKDGPAPAKVSPLATTVKGKQSALMEDLLFVLSPAVNAVDQRLTKFYAGNYGPLHASRCVPGETGALAAPEFSLHNMKTLEGNLLGVLKSALQQAGAQEAAKLAALRAPSAIDNITPLQRRTPSVKWSGDFVWPGTTRLNRTKTGITVQDSEGDCEVAYIAFAECDLYHNTVVLTKLWVDARYRKKGFGSALMQRMYDEQCIGKSVRVRNASMDGRGFYSTLGFQICKGGTGADGELWHFAEGSQQSAVVGKARGQRARHSYQLEADSDLDSSDDESLENTGENSATDGGEVLENTGENSATDGGEVLECAGDVAVATVVEICQHTAKADIISVEIQDLEHRIVGLKREREYELAQASATKVARSPSAAAAPTL
jgi:GNAT superfamily N-acetyltransferase